MDPTLVFKNFSHGKVCAVCGSNENVHTMRVTINNEDMMAAVCQKATCRGAARRNSVQIDVAKTMRVPAPLQHIARAHTQRRQQMQQHTKNAHASHRPNLTEAAARHPKTSGLQHHARPTPRAAGKPRDHPQRPAPAHRR